MTNNSHTVFKNIWLLGVALIFIFLFAPKYAHAGLSSSQYTLTGYGFGQGNTTLASSNFTLTTSNRTSANLSTFITQPTPGNSGGRGGSRGRSALVLETIQTNTGGGIGSIISEGARSQETNTFPNGNVITENTEVEDISEEDVGNVLTPVNTIGTSSDTFLNLTASLIGAHDAFIRMFESRGARATLFGGVIVILWYVRTYTALGRKYRPF